jgi:hypothetical protein
VFLSLPAGFNWSLQHIPRTCLLGFDHQSVAADSRTVARFAPGVCDDRTVKPDELVGSDLVYPNRVGETYSVKYSPDHQWFYAPEMTVEEVLLLKCFDSRTDGRARFAPHSAFADPTTPPNAPPREGIESRTLVFHKN